MTSATEVLRLLASFLLLTFATYIAAINYRLLYQALTNRPSATSYTPAISGICGALGLLALPYPGVQKWWWVSICLEVYAAPMVVAALVHYIPMALRNRHSGKRPG